MKKIILIFFVVLLFGCQAKVSQEVKQLQTKYGDCHPSTEAEEKFMAEYNKLNEQAKIGLKGDYENKVSACIKQTDRSRCESETFDFKGENFKCEWK